MSNLNSKQPKGKFGYYIFFLLITLSMIFLFVQTGDNKGNSISYSEFLTKVEEQKISEVYISDNQEISGYFISSNNKGVKFNTVIPYFDSSLI